MSSGDGLGLPGAGAAAGLDAGAGASWIDTANVSGPTCTRSRSLRVHDSVVNALPLTRVPLRLPRSRTIRVPASSVNSACSRLTCSLFGLRWHVSPRPILNLGPAKGMTFPSGLPRTTTNCTFMETVPTFSVNNDNCQRQLASRHPTADLDVPKRLATPREAGVSCLFPPHSSIRTRRTEVARHACWPETPG